MADRVDKQWQSKGLGAYSTEAIFGTLQHYGVSLDEPKFKDEAKEKYPLELALEWQPKWTGKGQFARFHWAAAEELAKRLFSDRLMPGAVAHAIHDLMVALSRMAQGAADAPVGTSFKKVHELKAQIPLKDGKPEPRFVNEVRLRLGEDIKAFASMAQDLAKQGHVEDAEEFAGIEEFLFPQWAGVSKAMVRAGKGEKAQALADLAVLVQDPNRDGPSKATAVDALIHLDALPQARDAALAVLDLAVEKDDLHLALEMGQRAMWVMEKLTDLNGMQQLVPKLERLHARHATEHQH